MLLYTTSKSNCLWIYNPKLPTFLHPPTMDYVNNITTFMRLISLKLYKWHQFFSTISRDHFQTQVHFTSSLIRQFHTNRFAKKKKTPKIFFNAFFKFTRQLQPLDSKTTALHLNQKNWGEMFSIFLFHLWQPFCWFKKFSHLFECDYQMPHSFPFTIGKNEKGHLNREPPIQFTVKALSQHFFFQ